MREAYHHYMRNTKHRPRLTEVEFRAIINEHLAQLKADFLAYGYIKLPCGLGSLKIKSVLLKPVRSKLVEGRFVLKPLVDWKKTKELWREDPEAKEEGLVVRYMKDKFNFAYYHKTNSGLKNLRFEFCKTLKGLISKSDEYYYGK